MLLAAARVHEHRTGDPNKSHKGRSGIINNNCRRWCSQFGSTPFLQIIFDSIKYKKEVSRGVAITQWIPTCLPFCHPGFESQAHHQCFYQFIFDLCHAEKTKINKRNKFLVFFPPGGVGNVLARTKFAFLKCERVPNSKFQIKNRKKRGSKQRDQMTRLFVYSWTFTAIKMSPMHKNCAKVGSKLCQIPNKP